MSLREPGRWRSGRLGRGAALAMGVAWMLVTAGGCQGYPFELRDPSRSAGTRIFEVVAAINPTDILLVIDNSDSMVQEIEALRANLELFAETLSQSDNDFRVGVITTDIECNIPEQDCGNPTPTASVACCSKQPTFPQCAQATVGGLVQSNCDGGRLRASDDVSRVFDRPSASERAAWVERLSTTIERLGDDGSAYEAGLEAARRALECAGAASNGCSHAGVSATNAGWLREQADLALVFLTDEDDCSMADSDAHLRPANPVILADQQTRLCAPSECYAFHDGVGMGEDVAPKARFRCGGAERLIEPPATQSVSTLLDAIVATKGGDVRKVRGAFILGSIADDTQPLGARASGCRKVVGSLPSAGCFCLEGSDPSPASSPNGTEGDKLCDVTAAVGHTDGPTTQRCQALPGTRYMAFAEELASRRQAAGVRPNTLVGSICSDKYDQLLTSIINTVVLSRCFELGQTPASADQIQVQFNGEVLPKVDSGTTAQGWSFAAGESQICLEGGLKKSIHDTVDIFVLANSA